MPTVPKPERRKRRSYAKGAERRNQLMNAAAELLESATLDDLALKDIAEHAGIPFGSAYHFFANANDVYVALAQRFGESLQETLARPYSKKHTGSWQDLFDAAIDRGAAIYADSPAYRQLILGPQSPPEIKLADRQSDEAVGQLVIDILKRHFVLEEEHCDQNVFFFATEIVDLMFTLSVIRHGVITKPMLAEAKVAGRAYLSQYLPAELEAR